MRALFWKEVRENWFVAGVGSLVFGATLTVLAFGRWRAELFVDDDLFGGVILNAAALGFLLGLFQVVRDRVFGRWPFLVHRPMSMREIFAAKSAAGLSMYFVAMTAPFLALLVFAASSDSLEGPFLWGLSQPGLADILGGVPFYFAGIVAGTRDRRTQHGRIIGIVLALAGTGWSFVAASFTQVLIGHVLCGALVATAAWGSFLRGGRTETQPAASRLSLGLSYLLLSLGICAGGACLVEAACDMRDQIRASRDPLAGKAPADAEARERVWEWLTVDSEGRLLKRIMTYPGAGAPQPRSEVIRGSPLEEGRDVVETKWADIFTMLDWEMGRFRRRGAWFRQVRTVSKGNESTYFYWIPSKGTVEVHGYLFLPGARARKRLLLKSIDCSKLLPAGERIESLDEDGLLATRSGLYRLSWDRGTLETLYDGRSGRIASRAMGRWNDGTLCIATESGLVFLDPARGEMKNIAYPHGFDLTSIERILISAESDRRERIVFFYSNPYEPNPYEGFRAMAIKPGAQVLEPIDLPPLKTDTRDYYGEGCIHFPYGSAVPVVGLGMEWASGFGMPLRYIVHEVTVAGIFSFPAACAVGLISAALGFWRGRRFAFGPPALAGWAVANALLGAAGLLTMLFYCDWPARAPCPGCGRKRRVDRELCHACGAAFPKPPLDGTEILERPESRDATNFDASLRT